MSLSRMCLWIFCLHCQIFLQQDCMLIKVSLKTSRLNKIAFIAASRVIDLCSQTIIRESVINSVYHNFRLGSLVTRWSEFNLTTNLLYIHVRFFEFYSNKFPTVEFTRGRLEYSSPCHCDRENIYRWIKFMIFEKNRRHPKLIFSDFDETH